MVKNIYYNDTADGKQHKKKLSEMETYDIGNGQRIEFDSMYKAAKPVKSEEEY